MSTSGFLKKINYMLTAGRSLKAGFPWDIFYTARFKRRSSLIREPKELGAVEFGGDTEREILHGLASLGVPVKEFTVDMDAYRGYMERAGYARRYPGYYSFNIQEKSLEHFIAAELMEFKKGDVYIDIASERSPAPEIYSEIFGCRSYRQDLSYPAGLNGDRIGGNAAKMPVGPGFADSMALHCSFEHFEGSSDIDFVREAGRVLKKGGRCCIVPLYLFDRYAIQTDPGRSEGVDFEGDAVVYCAPRWGNRHGRFYDPAHLKTRVVDNLGALGYTLYRITNARAIHPSCYAKFAMVLKKPLTEGV